MVTLGCKEGKNIIWQQRQLSRFLILNEIYAETTGKQALTVPTDISAFMSPCDDGTRRRCYDNTI